VRLLLGGTLRRYLRLLAPVTLSALSCALTSPIWSCHSPQSNVSEPSVIPKIPVRSGQREFPAVTSTALPLAKHSSGKLQKNPRTGAISTQSPVTIHELLEMQAERSPDAIAVTAPGRTSTFAVTAG